MVTLVHAAATLHLPAIRQVAFCFLDGEKELYAQIFDQVAPSLVYGGFFTADNALSHQDYLQPFIDRALADNRVDALIALIGKGALVGRKI